MAVKTGHRQVIEAQIGILDSRYREFIGPGQAYALVDFPNHSNVGDSAIWAGETALLRAITGHEPAYVCDFRSYDRDALKTSLPDGPILIHGGGNFGDLWQNHHDFRLKLMVDFPGRAIVQLPQSIHFQDERRAAVTAEAIRAHGRFRLLVRDLRSQAIATNQIGTDAPLCPDSAFALGPLHRRGISDHDIMALMRTDSEVATCGTGILESRPDILVDDWIVEQWSPAASLRRSRLKSALQLRLSSSAQQIDYYDRLANWRLDRGLRLLARGRVVITDRLHAHILSTLMGIPHVALDNSYGKISSYIAAWTRDYADLHVSSDLDDAVDKALSLSPGRMAAA